jgi:tetratricopeptide (TPR) repeat protein
MQVYWGAGDRDEQSPIQEVASVRRRTHRPIAPPAPGRLPALSRCDRSRAAEPGTDNKGRARHWKFVVKDAAQRSLRKTLLAILITVSFLSACGSFRIAEQFAAGRRAFVAKNYQEALGYLERVARRNPDYVFESLFYRQGIWNYVGRAQYYTGNLADARRSLERALSMDPEDHLAKIYLGLVRARAGDLPRGWQDVEGGMKGLHGWLERYESTRPFEPFWDPGREIRSAIEKQLDLMSTRSIDGPRLMALAEWLGERMEYEIDEARRQESRTGR